ncbi:MAG: type II toxin-antitoxin system HipA family toxin [Holophaga sp.]|nr:type II toxin-antitoxin system HipA family toxin [Holophaga sp.]
MSTPVIEVRIWDKRVGAVAADPVLGCYVFEYVPAWLSTGVELAPRTMPSAGYREAFAFPQLPVATFQGLPGMIADALPDAFGNALIDAWMQSKGIEKGAVTVLDRLAYMGKRGLGALEFKPAMGTRKDSQVALQMNMLVEAARSAVHGELASDHLAEAALAQIIRVGTSAGGARAKAVIAWNPKTEEIRSGQFDVPPGFEHWLLKFDGMGSDRELGVGSDYGRIEYAYYLMASAAGVPMSPSRLLLENGRAHFMTRRFDRDGNTKHHVQTLCAMEHLDYKQRATHAYGQAFMAIAKLQIGADGTDDLFRRMAFNVMSRNCDDHTKNIAFILKRGKSWALAPAYDVTHAYNPKGEWTYQHLLSVNGKFNDITRADLLQEADRFGVRNPLKILSEVAGAIASFPQFAQTAGLQSSKADLVAKDFRLF